MLMQCDMYTVLLLLFSLNSQGLVLLQSRPTHSVVWSEGCRSRMSWHMKTFRRQQNWEGSLHAASALRWTLMLSYATKCCKMLLKSCKALICSRDCKQVQCCVCVTMGHSRHNCFHAVVLFSLLFGASRSWLNKCHALFYCLYSIKLTNTVNLLFVHCQLLPSFLQQYFHDRSGSGNWYPFGYANILVCGC